MGNKVNRTDKSLQSEVNYNNIILKSYVNYQPRKRLKYKGCKEKCLFFCEHYRASFGNRHIYFIFVLQEFALCGQAKFLKKWGLAFYNFVFMNKSNEFIVLGNNKVQIWKIDYSYTVSLNFQFILNDKVQEFVDNGERECPFQIQLNAMDDCLVFSYQWKIYFFKKEMDGKWNCIQKLDIVFQKFILNDQGNILIVLCDNIVEFDPIMRFKIVIYIKINCKQWKPAKEIQPVTYGSNFCFLDNQLFALSDDDSDRINIWEVLISKQEVKLIKEIKLAIQNYFKKIYVRFAKQCGFLIASQSGFGHGDSVYFIKRNNKNFYTMKAKEINNGPILGADGGFIINIHHHAFSSMRVDLIKLFKIYQN